jgi:hypothetical protein
MRGKGTKILWEKQEKKAKIGETRQVKRKLALCGLKRPPVSLANLTRYDCKVNVL